MVINLALLIVGFVVLIKGADVFVDGAALLAKNFKLSTMFIGLTIISFGTSAPEFAVAIQSLLKGSGEIVLGNVIGSNILNILLILGLASMIHPLEVKNNTVKRELPIALLITILLIVLISDSVFGMGSNSFSRQDGFVVCLFFLVFLYYLVYMMRNNPEPESTDEGIKYSIPKSIFFIIIGLVCVILGSDLVVTNASNIAIIMGISERMVALTIVAIGTSLPELVTSIIATKKGEYNIAIGNIVGSNIYNIGLVLGVPVVLFGGIENISFNTVDLSIMFVAALLLFLFAFKDRKLNRAEGVVMFFLFAMYYSHIIFCSI